MQFFPFVGTLLLVGTFFAASPVRAFAAEQDNCKHTLIWSGKSSDGKWIASVDQEPCQIAPIVGATMIDVVQLTPADHSGQPIDLLEIDTRGDASAKPIVFWKQKNELDVILPKKITTTNIIKTNVGDVNINVMQPI